MACLQEQGLPCLSVKLKYLCSADRKHPDQHTCWKKEEIYISPSESDWNHEIFATTYYPFTLSPHLSFFVIKKKLASRDLPGGPVAKTAHSQCRGPEFDHW